MTEGLQGVLIGGAIGIIGSIVVETLRARHHQNQTNREHRANILEKRKAALIAVLEHFRKMQAEIMKWGMNPLANIEQSAQWDQLTGFMPHLAILPEPFPGFVRKRAGLMFDGFLKHKRSVQKNDPMLDLQAFYKQTSSCMVEVTERATREIALIDAEIMGVKKNVKPVYNASEKIDDHAQ